MSDEDRKRVAFLFCVVAVAMLVMAVTGGCARNGLGGYEPIKIFGR